MATAEKKTRETNFNRSYNALVSEVSHEDAVIASLDLSKVPAEVMQKAAIRYLTDGIVGAGNAALKADGGNIDMALEKMAAAIESAYDGSWKFRAASGESGLTTEQEHNVIAEVLAEIKKEAFTDVAAALTWVQNLYAEVTPQTRKAKDGTSKTVDTRPKYNKLKRVEKIRSALAKAQPAEAQDEFADLGLPQ